MKTPTRIAWHDGRVLHVIRLGKTTNAKIARPTDKVLQTYHFDLRQLALVRSHLDGKRKIPMSDFFDLDAANCMDCPLSSNSGNGKCYTHKYMQFSGFVSMLKSLCHSEIREGLDDVDRLGIKLMAQRADFIRFGTYGEPSLLPLDLVGDIVVAGQFTGWRAFVCVEPDDTSTGVQCPASKELSVSNCSTCGLCSGISGKGKKNIKINIH
jgi:hypothetical protein